MSTTVFISSTSRDLLDHRAAVAKALLNAGFHPIDMANFMARPEGATGACLKEVAESDLFVGIYAWRYGYIPAGAELSITEQEFIEAGRLNKPCFIFMVDETYPWPDEFKEGGLSGRLLREFKARLDTKLVRTIFTTPEDLAGKVLASLARWQRNHPQSGQAAPETTPAASGGPTFQTGDIKAAIVNQGGAQTFGDITFGNLDFGENHVQVEQGGTYVAGDQMTFSGDFRGAILNIKSQLSNVTQNIGALPNLAQADKAELSRLVDELKTLLEQTPPAKAAEAETVAKRTEKLVQELKEEKPDPEMVEMMGHSLKKAAENLAVALPAVLPIATRIVAYVLKLAG